MVATVSIIVFLRISLQDHGAKESLTVIERTQ